MSIVLQSETPPLRQDEDGSIRVGQTRVLLEIVIHAFQNGASPETIVQQYPALKLPDVYGVIAYYLRHRAEIDTYLAERDLEADEIRRTIEASQGSPPNLRELLDARRSSKG